MTKISELKNSIDKMLDPSKKEVDRKTYSMYQSINEDLEN